MTTVDKLRKLELESREYEERLQPALLSPENRYHFSPEEIRAMLTIMNAFPRLIDVVEVAEMLAENGEWVLLAPLDALQKALDDL